MPKRKQNNLSTKCNHTSNNTLSQNKTNSTTNNWIKKNKIRRLNPSVFHFNKSSHFIYEPRYNSFFFDQLSNKNKLKPKTQYLIKMEQKIASINSIQQNKYFPKNILIRKIYKDYLDFMKPIIPSLDQRDINIKQIIDNSNKSMNLSTRKIKDEYEKLYKEKISHTTVSNILKKHLNYHFVKCSVKTDKLLNKESIRQTFFYLFIFLKCLNEDLNLVFIDESSINTKNNNYKTWLLKGDDVYNKLKDSEKRNLILAVNPQKNIFYKITNTNTNSKEFKEFFTNLLTKLSDKDKENTLFVLDNLPAHCTPEMFSFYNENKLKILFGVPYLSKFNMIEFCFRGIKNILYKHLFNSIKDAVKKTEEILLDPNFYSSYIFFFKETLNNYKTFINKYKEVNLNN